MTTFYERFTELCIKNGVSQSKVMTDIGFTRGAASSWSKGRGPNRASVKVVAEYFGVDPSYFYDDVKKETKEPIVSQALGAMIMMPVIGSVKAGYGAEAIESYTGEYQYIGADMVHNRPQDYRVLEVKGDSMYPFFLPGDRVVVHLQPDAESGETIVAILGNGDGTIKKLRINNDGSKELVPSNVMYPPMKLSNEDRIYGKVVNLIRNV